MTTPTPGTTAPTGTAAPGDPGLAGVARGGLANLAGAGFAAAAGLAVAWLAARALGPATAGGFFAATAAFTVVAGLAKLGTPTGLVYWLSRLRAELRPALLGACLRAGLTPVAAASLLLAVGLWLSAPRLGGMISDNGAAGPALRVLAVFLPLAALTDALLAATRGYRRMRPTVALDKVLRSGLQLLGVAALALIGLAVSVPLAAWTLAWALPYLPVLLLAGYAARATHRGYLRRLPPSWPTERRAGGIAAEFWRFTAPRALAGTLHLCLQRLDIVLVAALAGPVAAAVYTVSGRFVAFGQLANQAIGTAIQPRLAERLAAGDRAAAGRLYQAATAWLVLLSWPFYLLMLNFAGVYLALFGPAYRGGVAVVVILASVMLLATGCGAVDTLLAMAGRTRWNLLNVSLALAVLVGAGLLLIPRFGATGAAVALATAVAVNNLLPVAQVNHALGLHPFGRGTVLAGLLALGCYGVLPAVVTWVLGTTVTSTLLALATGTAGYLLGARRLRQRLELPAVAAALRLPRPRSSFVTTGG